MNFLVLPLFLLSGTLFPLREYRTCWPSSLVLTRFRMVWMLCALLTDTGYYGLGIDVAVLGAITLVFLWLGGYSFKKVQA
jgi:hypothetical protein